VKGIPDELSHLRRLVLRGRPPEAEVVALEQNGDFAVAVVRLIPSAAPRYEQVVLVQEQGAWRESYSGNGPGWTTTSGEMGVQTVWGDAPSPSGSAIVEFRNGVAVEASVNEGFYFTARWEIPESMIEATEPRPPRFRE
jgi:hypothetical protein